MTVDQTEKLKALALAATPGEWTAKRFGCVVGGPMRHYVNGSAQSQIATFNVTFHSQAPDDEPERQQANAEFCAAANPAAVLELITEVERLRADPLYSTRQDAERFRRAIALEDNADSLCAAVMNNGRDADAIRREFDAAIEKEKA